MTRSDARKRLDESIDRLECADHQGTCPTPIELLRYQLRTAEAAIEKVAAFADFETARADRAEAEASDLSADYDRRGERLWRLAALAGYAPCESDNDATAELAVADALAARRPGDEDRLRAALREVLSEFYEVGHPGRPAVRTGWVDDAKVQEWRAVLACHPADQTGAADA